MDPSVRKLQLPREQTRAAVTDRLAYCIWAEAPDAVRLRRALKRDGERHRELWLDSMTTERQFFADHATRTRADLRVNGNSGIPHDRESEVVVFDQLAAEAGAHLGVITRLGHRRASHLGLTAEQSSGWTRTSTHDVLSNRDRLRHGERSAS